MDMSNRQRVIDLALKIQETRGHLALLESELDALIVPRSPPVSPPVAPKPEATHKGRRNDGKTLPERILGIMREDPSRAFTAADFKALEDTGIAKMLTIRTSLVRLFNNGIIAKSQRGSYRLKPEAPQESIPHG
jgi:hypothetical protein